MHDPQATAPDPALIGTRLATIATALGLVSVAMRDTIVFFHTPSGIQAKGVQPGTRFRLGGHVQEASVESGDNQIVVFRIKDADGAVRVQHRGLLPDLFRERQGVVAEGMLDPAGMFKADTVLAKHDANDMPREVADTLKSQGHGQGEEPAATGTPWRVSLRFFPLIRVEETSAVRTHHALNSLRGVSGLIGSVLFTTSFAAGASRPGPSIVWGAPFFVAAILLLLALAGLAPAVLGRGVTGRKVARRVTRRWSAGPRLVQRRT